MTGRLFDMPADPAPDAIESMLAAGFHPATGLPLEKGSAVAHTCGTCAYIHYQPRGQRPLCVMARFYGGTSYTLHYWPACDSYRLYNGHPSPRARRQRRIKANEVSAPTIDKWLLDGEDDGRIIQDTPTDEKFL